MGAGQGRADRDGAFAGGDGAGDVAGLGEKEAEHGVSFSQVWILGDRGAAMVLGGRQIAAIVKKVGEVEVGRGGVRLVAECAAERVDGFGEAGQELERHAALIVGGGECGIEADGGRCRGE